MINCDKVFIVYKYLHALLCNFLLMSFFLNFLSRNILNYFHNCCTEIKKFFGVITSPFRTVLAISMLYIIAQKALTLQLDGISTSLILTHIKFDISASAFQQTFSKVALYKVTRQNFERFTKLDCVGKFPGSIGAGKQCCFQRFRTVPLCHL